MTCMSTTQPSTSPLVLDNLGRARRSGVPWWSFSLLAFSGLIFPSWCAIRALCWGLMLPWMSFGKYSPLTAQWFSSHQPATSPARMSFTTRDVSPSLPMILLSTAQTNLSDTTVPNMSSISLPLQSPIMPQERLPAAKLWYLTLSMPTCTSHSFARPTMGLFPPLKLTWWLKSSNSPPSSVPAASPVQAKVYPTSGILYRPLRLFSPCYLLYPMSVLGVA